MAGKLMLAVVKRPQFLATWNSPQAGLSILPTWQLVFPE